MRGRWPVYLVVAAVAALLGWYAVFTQGVIAELQRETEVSARMYARIYRTLGDTSTQSQNNAVFDLSREILEMGVPVIVTDASGRPTAHANLPFRPDSLTDPRLLRYLQRLDREHLPIEERGMGQVHIGNTPLVSQLQTIPVLQGAVLALLLLLGGYLLWTRERAEREHVWMGMAREAAHQLGTPLTSLSGWIEVLRDRAEHDGMLGSAVEHMDGDLERLTRVANRFERIGRPPRRDPVDVGALAARVAEYFRARVPTLAHQIAITTDIPPSTAFTVYGDAVLLEWVLESLVKNAIDALAGRGGRIAVAVSAVPEGGVRVRVADDGPGVPKELRARIFEAGFSTKEHGWGIGLSLARRIVEESHRGQLALATSGPGATFDIILK
ncbi:MAG: HAMP domain-containing sensor histidine kinase [Gemmatimonadaceae bacterium]|nr:HAMP domain-containing sensor histidine kinase [Gemmatimonadaceae bacterium]